MIESENRPMNKIFLALAIFLTAFTVHAQFVLPKIGVTGTYNNQSLYDHSAKPSVGFLVGLAYTTKSKGHLSFQTELYFIQKSFNMEYSYDNVQYFGTDPLITSSNSSDHYKLNYLELAGVFKYTFLKGKMFAVLGPYFSVGLGGRDKYIYSGESTSNGKTVPSHSEGTANVYFGSAPSGTTTNTYIDRHYDFGFMPGLGVIVFKNIQLEARTGLGLISIYHTRHSKNEVLMFTASMPFKVERKRRR
jgi:Outer membrane protein beta-barrel domain